MSPSLPKTILLVENEPLLLKFVRKILERAGYSVLSAATPEAAGWIERDFPETIDLLLTAASLPRLSGPELAEKLELRRPELRVMLMSGDPAARSIALNCGWSFTEKPFSIPAFLGKIKNALALDVGAPVVLVASKSRKRKQCA